MNKLLPLIFLLSSCASIQNPMQITCQGKGAISGTGTISVSTVAGFNGSNAWMIQADCGDGFMFKQIIEK